MVEGDADRGGAAPLRRMSVVFLILVSVGATILEGFATLRRILRILERQERSRVHEAFRRARDC